MSHMRRTGAGYDIGASKKRINITVNEDLLHVAQSYTDNLSGTIESLLAAWMQEQRQKRDDDLEHRKKVVAAWNDFDERCGRFADDWNRDFLPDDETTNGTDR
jgi:Post-segregation antitoxin (ccd killing mechanism protein) encoded by the F plasmid